MVAVEFRAELEDPDLDRPLAARLSRGPVGRLPGVHARETTGRADQVSVLPRRGPLGAAAAQPPRVVGNGARLARSVFEARAHARALRRRCGRRLGELPGLIWGGALRVGPELVARRRGADSPQRSCKPKGASGRQVTVRLSTACGLASGSGADGWLLTRWSLPSI